MSMVRMLQSRNLLVSEFLSRNVMMTNLNPQLRRFSLNSYNEKHTLTSINIPYCMPLRHHYYNTKHHPSKIVRAYRKTRNWLTEHFVFSEQRIENIYSASIMVTVFLAFCYVNWFFTLSGGPNAGLDVDRTQTKKE